MNAQADEKSRTRVDINQQLEEVWAMWTTAPDSALRLFQSLEAEASEMDDTTSLITAMIRGGVIHRALGSPEMALGQFDKGIRLAELQGDSLAVVRALINLSQTRSAQGDYDASLTHILRAIRILDQQEHPAYLTACNTVLASIYVQLRQYPKALEVYHAMLAGSETRGDSSAICLAKYNLGITHFELNNFAEAQTLLEESLTLSVRLNNMARQAKAHNALGSVSFEQANYAQAASHYKTALTYAESTGSHQEHLSVLNNLAEVYTRQQDWKNAITYFQQAEAMARSASSKHHHYRILKNLANAYSRAGKTDSAYRIHQRYATMKDSVFNAESQQQLAEVQTRYETEKKDADILRLNAVKSAQEADIAQRNTLLVTIGLIALLLGGAALVYQSRLRIQRALNAKKEELHQQETIQLVKDNSAETMKAYLNGETAERQRLASELHDRLGNQLAAVKLYYERLESEMKDPEHITIISDANKLLKQSVVDVRQIAHNLAGATLSEFGLEAAVANLANTITSSGRLEVKLRAIGFDERLPATLELVLFRSVQELITNVIKHAEASEVVIDMRHLSAAVRITVTDNGRGLPAHKPALKKGIGLHSIGERLEALNGTFTIETKDSGGGGRGTKAHLSIPVSNNEEYSADSAVQHTSNPTS